MKRLIFTGILFLVFAGAVGSPANQQAAAKTVTINRKNFPDKGVRRAVKKRFDKNKDGRLSAKEIKKAKKLELSSDTGNGKAVNLKGVSKLRNLRKLYLYSKRIKSVSEIKKIKRLTELDFQASHKYKTVDLSKNKKLKKVFLSGKKIKSFKLPSQQLKELEFDACSFRTMQLSGLNHLKKVSILYCKKLQNLRIENCTRLYSLDTLEIPQIERIAFKNVPKLTRMVLYGIINLKELDLSQTPNLESLTMDDTKSARVDFNRATKLEMLKLYENRHIKTLDISRLTNLTDLASEDGVLEEIIWGEKKKLEYIGVSNNRLKGSWNLDRFPNLDMFACNYNQIESIYAGKNNRYLSYIECVHNRLKRVDLRSTRSCNLICWDNPRATLFLPYRSSENEFDKSAKVYYGRK